MVDLDALAWNHAELRRRAPGAEIAGVVKADAYGLGLEAVVRTLFADGARTFFVADTFEGRALRAVLPEVTIYVLAGYAPGSETAFDDARLRPVLNTESQVRAFRAHGRGPAALQLDTGMTRLGIPPAALDALETTLKGVPLALVLSHLAAADEPDDAASEAQRRRFEEALARFPGVPASLANSAGLLLGPAFHFDLCRPGIAVYGGNPRACAANPMRPVVELDAQVLEVFRLDAPARIGYGRTYRAPSGARIATCAVGYADGLLRCTGNVATALAADVEVPFAGRVSMDLTGLDVTAVPVEGVFEGSRVKLIWGPDGVDRLAAAAGTIAYEVLVRLGPRVERHYVGGA